MNHAFSKILILIIFVILTGGGIFAWQYFGEPEEKTTDEIADWQTYYNERYGIEFKYPKLWVLDEKSLLAADHPDQKRNFVQINVSNGVSGPEDESMSPCQPGIAALVFQAGKLREGQQTFEEFVNFQIENPERGKPPAVKPELIQTTVGGHNAFVIKDIYDSCEKDFYYVEQSSSRYTTISFIVDKDEDNLIINQILSTFRFIETLAETADWKTYRNEEYGFEMKYPGDFFPTQPLQPQTKVIQCDYTNFANNCPTERTTINGMLFCLQETSEGAAGTTYVTYNYTTVRDRECFVVSFSVPYPNCSNYLPIESQKMQEAYDKCRLDDEVTKPETINKILSTFRFLE